MNWRHPACRGGETPRELISASGSLTFRRPNVALQLSGGDWAKARGMLLVENYKNYYETRKDRFACRIQGTEVDDLRSEFAVGVSGARATLILVVC